MCGYIGLADSSTKMDQRFRFKTWTGFIETHFFWVTELEAAQRNTAGCNECSWGIHRRNIQQLQSCMEFCCWCSLLKQRLGHSWGSNSLRSTRGEQPKMFFYQKFGVYWLPLAQSMRFGLPKKVKFGQWGFCKFDFRPIEAYWYVVRGIWPW
jgi:hypothetical protein